MLTMHILLPNHTNFKKKVQFENFVFVIMSTRENTRLIARAFSHARILKAIKNATGTSVIFSINISLIHFVFVLTSVPNVRERFTKT